MYTRVLRGWLKHWDFILLDLLCLGGGFALGFYSYINPSQSDLLRHYLFLWLFLSGVDLASAVMFNTFKNVLKRGYYLEFIATVKHVIIMMAAMAVILFVMKIGTTYSRVFTLLMMGSYAIFSYITRVFYKRYLMSLKGGRRVMMVITTRNRAAEIMQRLISSNHGSFTYSGIGLVDGDSSDVGTRYNTIEVLTVGDDIPEFLCRHLVDELFVAIPGERHQGRYVDMFSNMGIPVHSVLDFTATEKKDGRQRIMEKVGGYPVLTTTANTAALYQVIAKRVFDIIGSIVGILLTVILTIILGPIIYIKSPGPIFYSQKRVGKNGRVFKMYKFRSMYPDADERKDELLAENTIKDDMMFKLDFDPRVIGNRKTPDGKMKTGIGAFIRRTSIDEFPQFFNVLRGDMSLVGTRPPTVDEYKKYKLHHRARLSIKPGITGLWQISGRSDIKDFEEVVNLDKEYINNWNMGLDIKIILRTVKQIFTGRGAR